MTTPLRILLLEDNPLDADLVVRELRRAGFVLAWRCVASQAEYLAELSGDLDIILSDYALPDFNAMAALRLMQARGLDLPFVVVTGTISEEAAVECLKQGAADYILKDRLIRLGPAVQRALQEHALRLEKHQAEQALRHSEGNYRLLADNATDLIARYDANGICRYASPASEALLGYTPAEMVGQPARRFLHPEAAEQLFSPAAGAASSLTLVGRARRKQGSFIWMETTARLVRHAETGALQEVVTVSRDVSTRQRQLDELTVLSAVASAGTEAADEAGLIERATQIISQTVYPENFGLALLDESAGGLRLHPSYHGAAPARQAQLIPLGEGVIGQVAASGQAQRAAGTASQTTDGLAQDQLCVPLRIGGRVIGVCNAESAQPESFSPADERLLLTLAGQLAIALEKVRLTQVERRRLATLAALHEIGLDLSAQELDLQALLKLIVERAVRLLEVAYGGLYLMQPDGQTLEFVVSLNYERDYSGTRLRLGEGVSGRVAQTRAPLFIANYSAWEGRARVYDEHPMGAVISVPIDWQGQIIGVLTLGDRRTDRFGPNDVETLSLFADQAAVAIVNARQLSALRRRLEETDAFIGISRALNQTLDLDRILQMIVDAARRLIPTAERAVIHLLDEERQALRAVAVSGMEELGRPDFSMRRGQGIAGLVIADGLTVNVHDTATDMRFLRMGPAVHLHSLLVAPVQSATRRLGTLSASAEPANAFSLEDERLLTTLGLQASLAIENAALFEAAQQRLKEVNSLYHISQGISGSLDLDEVLQRVASLLQANFGYYHVHIYLLEPTTGELVMRHGSGPAAEVLRQRSHRLPPGVGIAGHVAAMGEAFVTNNVEEVVFFVRNPLLPDTHAEMAVPLRVNAQVVGVLDIQQSGGRELNEDDLRLTMTVADQLSVALQKALLHADLQTALKQEQAARSQLVQAEKLAAMGRLIASVAHELNNPLQAIQNALFLVKQESSLGSQSLEDLQVALTEADRMAELIGRLRETYRPATREQYRAESLNILVNEVERLISTHMRHHGIRYEFTPDPDLPSVSMLRDQVKQVILNLSLNAIEAMPSGGDLRLRTSHDPAGRRVRFTCSDTGLGIRPEDVQHIFDPFYTTKESGTGLGLAISYDIVQRHGGDIMVESAQEQGTTFTVWLPIQT